MNQPVIPSESQSLSVIGDLRLHEFESRIFRNRRMLRVWVPPGYDDDQNRERYYPVFYLNDGQNLFDHATAYIGVEWQVDETANRLIHENKIPPMIFVGIDNAQKDRAKEYLPYRSLQPPLLRPPGKRYPAFLLTEVMPFLVQRYRIARGPENTGLGGSSLGAIISLYTIMVRPGVFGRLLLESPSLFIAHRRLLTATRAFRGWPQRIYLAIGTNESGRAEGDMAVVDDVRHFERTLRRAGLGEDRLRVKIDEGATHSEAEWAKRFPEALQFLFGARQQTSIRTDSTPMAR
jgi:predicted alpha/beta superfamily hydrolase